MRLKINLATQPYEDARRFLIAWSSVIGVLALMVAAGSDLAAAMRVANHAAGIVVGKLGTAVVHRGELLESLADHR